MTAKQLFAHVLQQATRTVDAVRLEQYHQPTPDKQWDVHALASHMLYELCWVPDLVKGKTIAEVGSAYDGDLIGNALQANWHAAVERALDAVAEASSDVIVHISSGDTGLDDYLLQQSADQLIHTWDLGEGIGRPVHFESLVASTVHAFLLPNIEVWRTAGLFGPAVSVPAEADIQTQLLAATGRRVNWPAATQP